MRMFSRPSVIIVGAGASYDFGVPMGELLWQRVSASARALRKSWETYWEETPIGGPDRFLRERQFEDAKAFAYFGLLFEEGGNLHARAKEIEERVIRADFHSSVDDFLRDNPSLVDPLRVLIAATLVEGLYERDGADRRQWSLRSQCRQARFGNLWDGRHPEVENWLRRFVGIARPLLISAGPKIEPVTVISFNYDRLMETMLREFWTEAEREYPAFDECFRFYYPYGALSELPVSIPNIGSWIRREAGNIGLAGSEVRDASRMKSAIIRAAQVFSVGFSFSETNVQLLGMDQRWGQKVFAQNFGGKDERLARTLASLSITNVDQASMSGLVRNGFFEQRGPASRTRRQQGVSG